MNVAAGLPSPAGKNVAVLSGNFYSTFESVGRKVRQAAQGKNPKNRHSATTNAFSRRAAGPRARRSLFVLARAWRRRGSHLRNDPRVTLLAVKLFLAPSFVVGASLAARRFGVRVGGLVAGLPVVAGPILLAYALAHGRSFAAGAAAGTLLGLVSLIGFVVVYGRLAGRVFWGASMLAGWLAFILGTALFSAFSLPTGGALALAGAALLAGLAWLPRPARQPVDDLPHPAWDLPLRAGCALALVLTLTAIAGWLGPQLSGLLAPFPIIATVLATFTHAQRGPEETVRLLRGLVAGFGAFALFCFTLAISLRSLDTAPAFALATGVALLTQATVLALARHDSAVAPAQPGRVGA